MRNQPTQLKTRFPDNRILIIICIIVTTALTAAVLFQFFYTGSYSPPPFEAKALEGIPNPPDDVSYGEINSGSFLVGFAGIIQRNDDDSLQVYFVNPEENDVHLMCTIADDNGGELYKSGLLRPGEYLVNLEPITKNISGGRDNVTVEIYAFEPETYYSKGAIVLKNTVVDKEYE